jgi:hypothetical protein
MFFNYTRRCPKIVEETQFKHENGIAICDEQIKEVQY